MPCTMLHPSSRTDILGALDVAKEAFDTDEDRSGSKALILFSDFLEDDGTYRFVADRELANDRSAELLAKKIQVERGLPTVGVRVYLGNLSSLDMGRLTFQRQRAIRAFWNTCWGSAEISRAGLNGPAF